MERNYVYEYNRKPIKRERGQYTEIPEGLYEFAEKVANELCEKFPDIDILDLETVFTDKFRLTLRMNLLRGNAIEA